MFQILYVIKLRTTGTRITDVVVYKHLLLFYAARKARLFPPFIVQQGRLLLLVL
jgi:hypothetical protein